MGGAGHAENRLVLGQLHLPWCLLCRCDWAFTGFWFHIHVGEPSAVFSAFSCCPASSGPGARGRWEEAVFAELVGGSAPSRAVRRAQEPALAQPTRPDSGWGERRAALGRRGRGPGPAALGSCQQLPVRRHGAGRLAWPQDNWSLLARGQCPSWLPQIPVSDRSGWAFPDLWAPAS